MLSRGNMRPIVTVMSSLQTMLRRRNPGQPSYHRVANNCWQLGCATNWKIENINITTSKQLIISNTEILILLRFTMHEKKHQYLPMQEVNLNH